MNVLLQPGVRRREVWAWAMYDFANSGYTTVVITAVFSAYFVGVVAGNAPWSTFAWTLALSVSYALVMLTAPLVGAWADAHASKKSLLWLTTLGCVGFTAALYFAAPGALVLAIAALVLSNYFFGTGENLIAAFLPELARPRALGRVSGWGWSLGYVGGLVSLGASLAYISQAQATWAGRRQLRAGDHADHRGDFHAGEPAHAADAARACHPAAGAHSAQRLGAGAAHSGPSRTSARPQALPDLHRAVSGRHPGRDHAGGDLCQPGVPVRHAADHPAGAGGQHHGCARRIRVRPCAGPHRPCAVDCADAGRAGS